MNEPSDQPSDQSSDQSSDQPTDPAANHGPSPDFRRDPSTPPRHRDEVPLPPEAEPLKPNRLALVAFILSLVGFCVPLVAPLAALICGIIAVRRAPRGFAIAAIVIACVGGCFSTLLLPALLLPALAMARISARASVTQASGVDVLRRAQEFQADHQALPRDIVECYGDEIPPFDAWGTPLRLVIEKDGEVTSIFVWSAGEDEAWDSEDDWVLTCDPPRAASDKGYNESWRPSADD